MKKFIAILLSVLILCPAVCNAAAAKNSAGGGGNKYPVILINGRGMYTPYYGDKGEEIFPINPGTDFIIEKVKECLPYLSYGLMSGNYEIWADKVAEIIKPIYETLIPREDGSLYGRAAILNGYGYPLTAGSSGYDYSFNYDWRKDPTESADYLDEYIQQIKEATGCEKVSLVGRCYGSNVMASYLYEYGHDDIDSAVFYCSTALGCYATSCLFSGEIKINQRVLESFLNGTDIIGDAAITELLRSTVAFVNAFPDSGKSLDFVNDFIQTVFPVLAPKIFPISYGSMTCFWDMVDAEDYEKAKALIYNGNEAEYADFIAKTDHYHYDIAANLPEMLKKYSEEGMKVGVVAKYGPDAPFPIYDNGNPQSDDTVELKLASFGATSSEYGKVLSPDYLESADMRYVSSDHIVDASTAVFKDSTYIIKGIAHSTFPECIDRLICSICNSDSGTTVFTNEGYQQFMKYDGENDSLIPLTDKPSEVQTPIEERISFIGKVIRFFKSIFEVIKSLLSR